MPRALDFDIHINSRVLGPITLKTLSSKDQVYFQDLLHTKIALKPLIRELICRVTLTPSFSLSEIKTWPIPLLEFVGISWLKHCNSDWKPSDHKDMLNEIRRGLNGVISNNNQLLHDTAGLISKTFSGLISTSLGDISSKSSLAVLGLLDQQPMMKYLLESARQNQEIVKSLAFGNFGYLDSIQQSLRDFKSSLANFTPPSNMLNISLFPSIIIPRSLVTDMITAQMNTTRSLMQNVFTQFDFKALLPTFTFPDFGKSLNLGIDTESWQKYLIQAKKLALGIQAVEEAGYGFIVHELTMNFLVNLANIDDPKLRTQEVHEGLVQFLCEPEFEDDLKKKITQSGFLAYRWEHIVRGIRAHRESDYYVSVDFFIAEIEGIISDILIHLNKIRKDGDKLVKLGTDGNPLLFKSGYRLGKPQYVNGLSEKILLSEFSKIEHLHAPTNFLDSDIRPLRNPIKHGMNVIYNDPKLSAQTLLLLYIYVEYSNQL